MIKLLVLLAALGYGGLKLIQLRDRWTRRLLAVLPATPAPGFEVAIDAPGGRSGTVAYRERQNGCRLSWEVTSGPSSVLRVSAPASASWDRELPWASGRRQQVLARIAEEVVRQKCPGFRWEIDDTGVHLRA